MSGGVEAVPLGEVVRPTRPRIKPSDRPELPFIGMEHVEAHTMKLLGTVPSASMKSSAVHFKPGDVLYGRLRPYLNKVYRPRFEGLCSAEFIVLPENDRVDGSYLQYFLNSPAFVRFASRLNAGDRPRVDFNQLAPHPIRLPPKAEQLRVVAEIEKQFSRLDEGTANLDRVLTGLRSLERSTIETLTSPSSFHNTHKGTISDIAASLDHLRKPVNKTERASRAGSIPYLGANGQTGWIDEARFDEELVLVVEDETFIGRKLPFSYYFAGRCWVNNHTHVLRARREAVTPKYLNLALSFYPFTPLTTGSTGRRKLTKAALMSAPIEIPDLATQHRIVAEVDRCLSIVREVEAEVDANLKRAASLRQSILSKAFSWPISPQWPQKTAGGLLTACA